MIRKSKITVWESDEKYLRQIMREEGYDDISAFMHEVINYGLSGFLSGRVPRNAPDKEIAQ